ncbi:MAG: carboxypeptidase-like regulatory domain-containing protein, partial [Ekhidna sp.]
MIRITLILVILFSLVLKVHAQKSLTSFIEEMQTVSSKEFFYENEWIDTIQMKSNSGEFIKDITNSLKNSGFQLYEYKNKYVFIYPNKLEFEKLKQKNQSNLNGSKLINYTRIGDPEKSRPNFKYKLSGIITDEKNEVIQGGTVSVKNLNDGAITNGSGRFSIELIPGNYEIEFNYLGLESETRYVTFYSEGNIDITLYQGTYFLDEVVIEGLNSQDQLNESVIGRTKIKMATIEAMPAFLGEVDVLKSATMLPGVNVAGESSSYLNVRGGRNDQTLVLMNNAPVFTPGHLLGFFSVFNGDFTSDLSLYKGNIPSRFGTRASSVMDVRLGQWAKKKVNVYGGIGIVNTNLGVKAKFLDDKLDVHIGGRTSYSDWLFDLAKSEDILKSSARFRDENLIARFVPDQSNTFHLSLYNSYDYFKYSDQAEFEWKANNGSLEWDHLFNNDWVSSTRLVFSDLDNSSRGLEINEGYLLKNGISMVGFQQALSTAIGDGELDAGVEFNSYKINSGEIAAQGEISRIQNEALEKENV